MEHKPGPLTRRKVLAAAAVAPLALTSRAQNNRGSAAKPNIVFILADDMGYADLSCYGRREYKTTNIDSIGASSGRGPPNHPSPVPVPPLAHAPAAGENVLRY